MSPPQQVETATLQNAPQRNGHEGGPAAPPSEQPPGKPHQKLRKWAPIVLLILAGVAAYWWLSHRNLESTDDAQVNGHIAPISARISGNVLQVLVHNNSHVTAGQMLVRLDPRDYQARVDQAKAALAAAEAQANAASVRVPLTRATTASGTTGAEADLAAMQAAYDQAQVSAHKAATSGVAVAQADVATAQADNQKAQADLERMRLLVAKQEISRQQYDAYLAAAQVAAAQLHAARERLTAARQNAADRQAAAQAAGARVRQARAELERSQANQKQVNVSAAREKSALAAVQQARAHLEAAELDLSYTTILAPLNGQVTSKTVELGQTVAPGQPLMAVVPLSQVWVKANFKETQLAKVHPGDRAEVHVDMYDKTIEGYVASISAATGARLSLLPPENATGNFVKVVERIPVRIQFHQMPPGIVLRPGMNVEATIITK